MLAKRINLSLLTNPAIAHCLFPTSYNTTVHNLSRTVSLPTRECKGERIKSNDAWIERSGLPGGPLNIHYLAKNEHPRYTEHADVAFLSFCSTNDFIQRKSG